MKEVRHARPEDAVRLAEIEVFNYRLNFYPIFQNDRYYFSELTVPALLEEYHAEPERIKDCFVYDDGIVKGFLRINGTRVEKLFVEPAFQSRGIGRMLLDHVIEEAGVKELCVLEKNPRAIRFYERHGFSRTDERVRVDDTDEFFVVMKRE